MVVRIMIAKTPTRPSREGGNSLVIYSCVFLTIIVVQKMLAETRVELTVEYREDADLEG